MVICLFGRLFAIVDCCGVYCLGNVMYRFALSTLNDKFVKYVVELTTSNMNIGNAVIEVERYRQHTRTTLIFCILSEGLSFCYGPNIVGNFGRYC